MFDEFLAKSKRDEAKAESELADPPPDITALEWCMGVIQGRYRWDPHKFRAAQAVLPYTNPKLAAIVVGQVGGDVADRMNAARMRINAAKGLQALPVIDVPVEPS
jgi:hypothetical protein